MSTQGETEIQSVITATGLGVDGEHEPLFAAVDLAIPEGFHAIQMPGGPGQTALLLTLAILREGDRFDWIIPPAEPAKKPDEKRADDAPTLRGPHH